MYACLLCSLLLLAAPACRAQQEDWQARLHSRIAAHDLSDALAIADARLKIAPNDAEACAWRARILAWTHHWPEAETEYRRALAEAPTDADVLSGLAQLLYWEQRYTESLALLDRARELAPRDAGIAFARARDLAALGRRADAEEAYRQAHDLDPQNPQALEGLPSLKGEPRQELVIGNETDAFNYTAAANTQTVAWIAHWRWNWITSLSSDSFQRFGKQAEKITASATWRFSHSDAITLGGAAAHDNAIAKSPAGVNRTP